MNDLFSEALRLHNKLIALITEAINTQNGQYERLARICNKADDRMLRRAMAEVK